MQKVVYTGEQVEGLLAEAVATQEEKLSTHGFLKKVVETEDTTKVGYLREEEVGIPQLSMRTLKELSLYSEDIAGEKEWAEYFDKRAEILVSTSLSKDAKLIDLAVMNRREISTSTGSSSSSSKKSNKGWFKKRVESPSND